MTSALAPRRVDPPGSTRSLWMAGPNPLHPHLIRIDWVAAVRAGIGVDRALYARWLHDSGRIYG